MRTALAMARPRASLAAPVRFFSMSLSRDDAQLVVGLERLGVTEVVAAAADLTEVRGVLLVEREHLLVVGAEEGAEAVDDDLLDAQLCGEVDEVDAAWGR